METAVCTGLWARRVFCRIWRTGGSSTSMCTVSTTSLSRWPTPCSLASVSRRTYHVVQRWAKERKSDGFAAMFMISKRGFYFYFFLFFAFFWGGGGGGEVEWECTRLKVNRSSDWSYTWGIIHTKFHFINQGCSQSSIALQCKIMA